MSERNILREAKRRFIVEIESRKGECEELGKELVVSSPLSSKEALGEPYRDDFPLLRGKETLMQAICGSAIGQAFTVVSGNFNGSLEDVLALPLESIFHRAVFVSAMNAVLRRFGLVERTVHCKNERPGKCASCMESWIRDNCPGRVGLVGMQPALLEALVNALGSERVRVSDLAEAGKIRFGVRVQDGMNSSQIFKDCQIVFITGSTLVNSTIDHLMDEASSNGNRAVFYGTTIAGAAYLLGLERWCPYST